MSLVTRLCSKVRFLVSLTFGQTGVFLNLRVQGSLCLVFSFHCLCCFLPRPPRSIPVSCIRPGVPDQDARGEQYGGRHRLPPPDGAGRVAPVTSGALPEHGHARHTARRKAALHWLCHALRFCATERVASTEGHGVYLACSRHKSRAFQCETTANASVFIAPVLTFHKVFTRARPKFARFGVSFYGLLSVSELSCGCHSRFCAVPGAAG